MDSDSSPTKKGSKSRGRGRGTATTASSRGRSRGRGRGKRAVKVLILCFAIKKFSPKTHFGWLRSFFQFSLSWFLLVAHTQRWWRIWRWRAGISKQNCWYRKWETCGLQSWTHYQTPGMYVSKRLYMFQFILDGDYNTIFSSWFGGWHIPAAGTYFHNYK